MAVIGRFKPRPTMRTVGVDLSSSSKRTAIIAVEWDKAYALVGEPAVGLGDDELVQRLASAEWVGIDAPFGWPWEMVSAVHQYGSSGLWQCSNKDAFRYRRTDCFVRERVFAETGSKLTPLSVSSDRIALTARRMASLRERAYERSGVRFDRAGYDQVLEVYPVAALLVWGLQRGAYKTSRRADRRRSERHARDALLSAIEDRAQWLSWAPAAREACVDSDDALDALLGALVARAAALGLTSAPEASDVDLARSEGWIHLPNRDSLAVLLGDGI